MAKQTITYDPQVLNLVLYAGDGVNFSLTITDTLGAPVNLSGTMIAQIRPDRGEVNLPDAEFDVDLTDAIEGIAVLSLTGDQTQALADDVDIYEGVWDLEWTPASDEPRTLCQGTVRCLPDVSH